ncbi:MAG TPA: RidA family protein [Candidatus Kapabacteria bacterium]
MSKSIILTTDAPAPIGPYSQAIRSGNMLFCSGQVALDPKTGEMKNASIEEETRQSLVNLSAVVSAGGAMLGDVVKTTIFLTDLGNFATVNAIYDEFFGSSKPARSTVQVSALPKGANVEIECIAII